MPDSHDDRSASSGAGDVVTLGRILVSVAIASAFLRYRRCRLRPIDRVGALAFTQRVSLLSEWTDSPAAVVRAVETVRSSGLTALADGAFAALTLRDPAPGRRSLMLLFSDGDDTASWLPDRAVLDKAARTDVVVYTVARVEAVAGARAPRPKTELLADLASATGGRSFIAEGTGRLREFFERTMSEFRTRYLLTYSPRGVEPSGWHQLTVSLKNRSARVQARRGYQR